jgi:two-component system LytT family sensor kinase
MRQPLVRWPLLFGLWTVIGLSFAGQFYLATAQAGAPVTWRQALSGALGDWYVFALLAVPTVWLVRRFPIGWEKWGRSLALHVLGCVLFSAGFVVIRAAVAQWQGWASGRAVDYAEMAQLLLIKTWHFNLLIYWAIVVLLHAITFYRESQDRARRALELEKRLTEARLMALQMQLNPHFLFNALNGIATLMHRDVDTADRMLMKLAELLRLTLDKTGSQETTVRHETALLERYLDIERLRFGDRLRVQFDLAPETLEARLPTLLLQPLVENSIKHGLAARAQCGQIEVCSRREGEMLTLEIKDNGAGLQNSPKTEGNGVGLANARSRLEQLYGERQSIELTNRAEGGAIVRVQLPFAIEKK